MIAVALFGFAGISWIFTGGQDLWTGTCLKVGLIMGALWLALPVISRNGNWGETTWRTVIGMMVVVLVLIKSRVDFRIIVAMFVGVIVATTFLRPRSGTRLK